MKKISFKTALFTVAFICFGITFSNAQSERGKQQKRPTFEELLEKSDADEDGKLSAEEVDGPLKENFEKIDTDEDGFISEEEFENAPKPKRGKRKEN